ncbi:MAG: S-methyl-5-thioadenosine phosphorylase [Caeruleum heppii]|nr:MAG: S-methyl-5-thioadenosine phosphorylase [Caeruleum heppii]
MGDIADSYPDPVHIAVIGGTGIQHLPTFHHVASLTVPTPWGSPSSPIRILHHPSPRTGRPIPIAFLSRHGLHHELAPHEVPSRANIAALRYIGVRCVIAFSAVGSLQEEVKPRDFLVPDQVIDRTKGFRPWTFFEGGMVGHVGFAEPFDEELATVVRRCGHVLEGDGVRLHDRGTLICMEGPQFSTRAESLLYRSWSGAVINMSCLPEAKLAREAELAYCMICMATDYDSWHATNATVDVQMVMGHMNANAGNAGVFLAKVLDELSGYEDEEAVEGSVAGVVRGKRWEGQSRLATGMTGAAGRKTEALDRLEWLFPGSFKT